MLALWRPILTRARRNGRFRGMFDQAKAEQIVERVAQGEPLEAICRELPGAPTSRTVRRWIESDTSLASDFAHAREIGHDVIAWRARDVARGNTEAGSTGDVARDRLIVETDLKLLAKWDKRYGDRQAVELTGKDGADLFASMSKDQLRAEILRRMSNPELMRALGAALPGLLEKPK